jgi:diadenosine tetraphosphatase ApaH/serine/threonine PP2A family protein phosphatase
MLSGTTWSEVVRNSTQSKDNKNAPSYQQNITKSSNAWMGPPILSHAKSNHVDETKSDTAILSTATLEYLISQAMLQPSYLSIDVFTTVCRQVYNILSKEPNILKVDVSTVKVVGDIHGQLLDLVSVFKTHGMPGPSNSYLFLGDYVNRGKYSVEVITLLYLLKARYPYSVYLLRGNHEDENICDMYGHKNALQHIYKEQYFKAWQDCISCFSALPIAAVVNNDFFCVHGGIGPDVTTLQTISEIDRKIPTLMNGTSLLSQLLWSDPVDSSSQWAHNSRGAGFFFNQSATQSFLDRNSLSMMIRAHQMVMNGYNVLHGGKLMTIFSAPNYCNRCGNLGALLIISKNSPPEIVQTRAVERSDPNMVSRLLLRQPVSYIDALRN